MGYGLGVDIGTTWTAAAISRPGSEPQVLSLGGRSAAVPTVVHVLPDRSANVGDAAERRAVTDPDRVAREFKRRLGDTTPVLLGGEPWSPESLMATVLRWVIGRATELEGEAPERIVVTHPANWGPLRRELIEQAIAHAGVTASFITEPEAAAAHYAAATRVPEGAVVAVYDLGGGTFDATVLRKTADGFDVLGKPEGVERLGGLDFDAAVLGHVSNLLGPAWTALDAGDPATAAAVQRLRHDCVLAKEALSEDADATIAVTLPTVSTEVRLTRGEFEGMIRSPIEQSADALARALVSAGIGPDEVDRILLVGGSSRIPLVSQVLASRFHRPLALDTHPKHAVALGAARLALGGQAAAAAGPAAGLAAAPPAEPMPVGAGAPTGPGSGTGAWATAGPGPEPPPPRRFPVWIPVVAVLAVLGVVAALLLGGGGDEPQEDVAAGAGFCDVLTGLNGEVVDGNLADDDGVASAAGTVDELVEQAEEGEQAEAVAEVQSTFEGEADDPDALLGAIRDELGPFAEGCGIEQFAVVEGPGSDDPANDPLVLALVDLSPAVMVADRVECTGVDAGCASAVAFNVVLTVVCVSGACSVLVDDVAEPYPLVVEGDDLVAVGPAPDSLALFCGGGSPDPTTLEIILTPDLDEPDPIFGTATLSADATCGERSHVYDVVVQPSPSSGIELLAGSWSFDGAAEVCEGLAEADCADFAASFTSFIEITCDGEDCSAALANADFGTLFLQDDGRFVAGGDLPDDDGFQCDGGPDPTRWVLEITNVTLDDDGNVESFDATVTLESSDGGTDGNSCVAERVVAPGLATPFDEGSGDAGDDTGVIVVTVTLEWSSNADLDIVGFDANGDEVNAGNEEPNDAGGFHAGDDNAGCPDGDDVGFEQITWTDAAPSGTYAIDVNAFNVDRDGCGSGDYTLTIVVGDQEPEIINGSVGTDETQRHEFEVP